MALMEVVSIGTLSEGVEVLVKLEGRGPNLVPFTTWNCQESQENRLAYKCLCRVLAIKIKSLALSEGL